MNRDQMQTAIDALSSAKAFMVQVQNAVLCESYDDVSTHAYVHANAIENDISELRDYLKRMLDRGYLEDSAMAEKMAEEYGIVAQRRCCAYCSHVDKAKKEELLCTRPKVDGGVPFRTFATDVCSKWKDRQGEKHYETQAT